MEEKKIPTRAEVPVDVTWNLGDLFESDEEWKKEYEALQAYPAKLSAMAGTLGRSAEDLLSYFRLNDEIELRMSKLYGYASCKEDEDTGNSVYQDLRSKAFSTYVAIAGAGAFATPELIALPEETLIRFYEEKKELEEYRRSLERIRVLAPHTLTPAEEKLLSAAGEMASAPENIASAFRNADIKFPSVTDKDGVSHPLTGESFVALLENSDVSFRQKVYETYYDTLGSFRNTLASALDGQFRQLLFYANARHYGSTLEAALTPHEVPVSIYTNLISAVHESMAPMHRYVTLRKKMLGLDELHMYDVYTPIVSDAAQTISFEEAKETVCSALSVLGEDYIAMLKEGFENRWIDVYENVGKRGGAYSSGTSRPHPYVLLNHKDNLDSEFTLAHEMGHALHSYLSCQNQPVSQSDYVIFVAEVASTCNEVLLMRYLLGKEHDKRRRAYLINHFLDSFKGTLYRQTMFAEFEWQMGQKIENGDSLTADTLCAMYKKLNEEYFGPDMVTDDRIALEWARIPHFFYNYYVFQYATGFSAAVALANRILREGAPAVADYKKFLSGGCSKDPISLLKIAGVDMSSPEPVRDALKLFGELIDEMEALL